MRWAPIPEDGFRAYRYSGSALASRIVRWLSAAADEMGQLCRDVPLSVVHALFQVARMRRDRHMLDSEG